MANFCKKCGSPVDQSTGLCPNCTKAEFVNMQSVAVIEPKSDYINMPVADEKSSKTSKRNKNLSDKKPRKRNKKLIVAIISAILVVLIIGGTVLFVVPLFSNDSDSEVSNTPVNPDIEPVNDEEMYRDVLDMYYDGISSNWDNCDGEGADTVGDPDSVSYMFKKYYFVSPQEYRRQYSGRDT